jgi:hypothetical protein
MNGILNKVYREAVYEKTGRVICFHLPDSQSLDRFGNWIKRFYGIKTALLICNPVALDKLNSLYFFFHLESPRGEQAFSNLLL